MAATKVEATEVMVLHLRQSFFGATLLWERISAVGGVGVVSSVGAAGVVWEGGVLVGVVGVVSDAACYFSFVWARVLCFLFVLRRGASAVICVCAVVGVVFCCRCWCSCCCCLIVVAVVAAVVVVAVVMEGGTGREEGGGLQLRAVLLPFC